MKVYQVVMMAMVQSDNDPAEWTEGTLVDEMLISPSLSVATVQIAEQLSAAEMMARASITGHGVIDADVIEEEAPEAASAGDAAWTRPGPSKEIDDSIWNGGAGTLE